MATLNAATLNWRREHRLRLVSRSEAREEIQMSGSGVAKVGWVVIRAFLVREFCKPR